MTIAAPTNFPKKVSKSHLKELFEYAKTDELQNVIFTEEWLLAMGWTRAWYLTRKVFEVNETRQIYFMLKVRKLI